MRKLLLSILLFSPLALLGQASVYHPFPQDSVIWRLDCGGLGWSCNCTCTGGVCVNESDRQYYYGNDTVINGLTYHKLMMDEYNAEYWMGPAVCNPGCNFWVPNYYGYSGTYIGALREDVAQKKVYMYQTSAGTELLVYDFNLNVGDTLAPSVINITPYNKVNRIDSVLIGTQYHKRFWIWDMNGPAPTPQDSGYVALIEGIGSTFGLLEYLTPPFEYQCSLACVSIDSVTVYPAAGWNCNFMTAGSQEPALSSELNLLPNPATTQVTIQFPQNTGTILITDLLGKVVYQNRVSSAGSGQGKLTIETSGWDSGIYVVRAEGDHVAFKKLMIQK